MAEVKSDNQLVVQTNRECGTDPKSVQDLTQYVSIQKKQAITTIDMFSKHDNVNSITLAFRHTYLWPGPVSKIDFQRI